MFVKITCFKHKLTEQFPEHFNVLLKLALILIVEFKLDAIHAFRLRFQYAQLLRNEDKK